MSRIAAFVPLAILLAAGAVVLGQNRPEPKAAAPAQDSDHAADRAAIRAMMQSFVKEFQAGNAKGLAAHWTTEGEYHNEAGQTVRGRESLEKSFAAAFAKSPERKAEVRPKALRFLSSTSAVDEGSVTISKGHAEPAKRSHYVALFCRDEGQWRLAMLTETPDHEPSMDDLAWLIGSWKTVGDGAADIRTTYAWDANKKFIHVEFKITEKDKTLSGKQVIGVDPATGGIRSWTFESSGGVGEANWHADGDHWELHAQGSLPNGRHLSETNILRRVNDDAFTWQSIHRMLDDQEIADLAPVRVSRIKGEK